MRRFVLGDWEIRRDLNEIRKAAQTVRLQPRQMDLLVRLSSQPGEVIPRDTLLRDVWPHDSVNDEVLSRAIAELRTALGDSARDPRYIETIPKRGYRLVADTATKQSPRWRPLVVGCLIAIVGIILWFSRTQESDDDSVVVLGPPVVLTGFPGVEFAPDLHSDGRHIVYIYRDDTGSGLAIHDLSAGTDSRSTTGDDIPVDAAWRPATDPSESELYLAVSVDRDGECVVLAGRIQELHELARCGQNPGIGWMDYDNLIVGAMQGMGLDVVSLQTGQRRPLTRPDRAGWRDRYPAVSPDGSLLAFARGDGTVREVWIQGLQTPLPPAAVTSDGQLVVGLAWRDNQRLLFSSDRHLDWAVYQWSRQDRTISALGIHGARGIDVEKDLLVWERSRFEANIWHYTRSADPVPVIVSNRYDNHPTPSPAADKLAFISNRTDRNGLWLSDIDGGNVRRLLELPDARISRPAWHGSGSKMLVAAFDNTGSRLLQVDTEGNHSEISGSDGALEGYWDGDSVVYLTERKGIRGIREVGSNGVDAQVFSGPISHFKVVGDSIWYTLVGEDGLFTRGRSDENEHVANPTAAFPVPASSWNAWDVSDQHVAYVDDAGIWLSQKGSGSREKLGEPPASTVGLSLAIAPGEGIFVSQTDSVEVDILASKISDNQ